MGYTGVYPKINMNVKEDIIKRYKREIIIGIIVLIILLSFVWIAVENIGGGKFIFTNNSSYKIEYMDATFVNDDWQVSDTVKFENLISGGMDKKFFENFNLNNMEASLQLTIKFEGHSPFVVVAGYFDDLFTGNIKVNLTENIKDEVDIKIKATNGIIPSNTTNCNELYTIFVKEGYIE